MAKGGKYISLDEYVRRIDNFKEFEVNGEKVLIHTRKLNFKSIGRARLIVSRKGKDIICLATNRNDHATKIIADYALRWKIEDFYKDAKQHLGLEKCQLRDIEGIQKHWYLVLFAHSILKLGASESKFAESILRSSIGMKVKRSCMEILDRFVLWLMNETKSIEDVRMELVRLLYRQS